MSRKRRARGLRVGLPPGAAVYVGQPRDGGVTLTAFAYDGSGIVEHKHCAPGDVRAMVSPGRVVWLDCDGVHDVGLVSEVCAQFGVHPLAVEDILNTGGRPKLDVYEHGHVVIDLDMLVAEGDPCEIRSEHVTLVIGAGFVLSFQEGRAGDLFDPVRSRIRAGTGRIRTLGADYLLHALVDAIVDGYFVVVDRLEDRIDRAESQVLDEHAHQLPEVVHSLKSDLGNVRRAVFPLREITSRLLKGEVPLVTRPVEPYLRDLYDHVMQVLDMVEADRERLTSVHEVYLAMATHRMNDVMKVLTIVATIFIPLSWVAGIYGMNFDNMPELHWVFGYPLALGLMFALGGGMVAWFRHRRWI